MLIFINESEWEKKKKQLPATADGEEEEKEEEEEEGGLTSWSCLTSSAGVPTHTHTHTHTHTMICWWHFLEVVVPFVFISGYVIAADPWTRRSERASGRFFPAVKMRKRFHKDPENGKKVSSSVGPDLSKMRRKGVNATAAWFFSSVSPLAGWHQRRWNGGGRWDAASMKAIWTSFESLIMNRNTLQLDSRSFPQYWEIIFFRLWEIFFSNSPIIYFRVIFSHYTFNFFLFFLFFFFFLFCFLNFLSGSSPWLFNGSMLSAAGFAFRQAGSQACP